MIEHKFNNFTSRLYCITFKQMIWTYIPSELIFDNYFVEIKNDYNYLNNINRMLVTLKIIHI